MGYANIVYRRTCGINCMDSASNAEKKKEGC